MVAGSCAFQESLASRLANEMTAEQRAEWETEVRSLYDSMVRIVVKPTWAKLIDFHETLPSAVEELIRRRQERQELNAVTVSRSRTLLRPSVRPPGSPSEKEIAPCESS